MWIAISLFVGWVLSWFGFDTVVATGMSEVFGTVISTTSYYFLFGLIGALQSIVAVFNNDSGISYKKDIDLGKKK